MPSEQPRRAGVVGSPIAHSLSPVLHSAAYGALGLAGWSYERIECGEAELPALVTGLDPSWVGLSVTMPGKRAALGVADTATERARAVGVANTLVRTDSGWHADCTDVAGVTGSLRAAGGFTGGRRGVILGAGGTAVAVLAGFAELGLTSAQLVVRDPARADEAVRTARRVGLDIEVLRFDAVEMAEVVRDADVVVSTLPAGAVDAHVAALATAPCVLDVVYHPWPTPLAAAVQERGGAVATGLDMLLHQAFDQVEHFTGRSAPRVAMREALRTATGGELPLPLLDES